MAKNIAVFGLYPDEARAGAAVNEFRLAGFRNVDVSALFSENGGDKDLAVEKNTKAPEGTAAGAGSGALLGGALGWLAGVGALAIPGVGPFVAAGPLMGLLSGIGVGGAIGGIAGGLIGAGMHEYEAKRYEGRVRTGAVLLSIHCDNPERAEKAKSLLNGTGAEDIASTPEAKPPSYFAGEPSRFNSFK